MAVVHRALFTWFMALGFIILLVLRLDDRVHWNWFIILIPMWIFDSIKVIYVLFNIISHMKHGYDRNEVAMKQKLWHLVSVVLKMGFQVLLCLKLQYVDIPIYAVMLPLWLLLVGVSVNLLYGLIHQERTL